MKRPFFMTEAQEYIAKLAKVFQLEKQEEIEQFQALSKSTSLTQRKNEGITWFPLKVRDERFGMSFRPIITLLRNPSDRSAHRFQTGSGIALFDDASGQNASGMVQEIDDSEVTIILQQDELPEWLDSKRLGINLLFDMRTFEQGEIALQGLLNADKGRLHHLREVAHGTITNSLVPIHPITLPSLNDSQNDAVNHVLASEDIAIVHGPPGTGKTTTISAAIEQLVKKEKQVLACAPSNAAVDHLVRKLLARGLKVVRIGNVPKIQEDILDSTLDHAMRNHKDFGEIKKYKKRADEFRKLAKQYKRSFGSEEREQRKALFQESRNLVKDARKLEDFIIEDTLNSAQVIACTLVGANHRFLRNITFKTAIIDEAGQALEPLSWIPVLKSEKLVLCGDPLQLPPTVKSREAMKNGMSVTLLERMLHLEDVAVLLNTQYRMHERIMSFSNSFFYDDKLIAHPSVANHKVQGQDLEIEFIDTAGCGFNEKAGEAGSSKYNPEEAQLLFRHLRGNAYPTSESIGIITPYREQLLTLKKENNGEPYKVSTVDSFQGQERDIIYISLVRSNDRGEIGFLKDYRRMNVAMTRARKKLVIVGDSATIGQDDFYSKFIIFCEENGFYKSAWEYMS